MTAFIPSESENAHWIIRRLLVVETGVRYTLRLGQEDNRVELEINREPSPSYTGLEALKVFRGLLEYAGFPTDEIRDVIHAFELNF